MQLVHAINKDDYTRRVQFCIDELSRIEANPLHLQFLLFSDEATFHINGHPVQSPKTTVWCGLWLEGIVGPFFFDGTVTGQNYLTMLQREFLPELASLHMQKEVCIFMQDGAPPHLATETFPGRWMGRGSPTMPWPARSPDLTPCDFFLWGYVKSKVYSGQVSSLQQLKARIENAIRSLDIEILTRVFVEYRKRLQKCIDRRGHHIECWADRD
ncbi:uncharacterized protein LOC135384303 [Ornithodoros turicata]|uniref:uncharacterized protein LOC135384303 n=1 Tax=Ornithodoros turicata TaxID=34597 RepID=UPI0031398386